MFALTVDKAGLLREWDTVIVGAGACRLALVYASGFAWLQGAADRQGTVS